MLSSIPRWARVSALVLGVGLGSEVLYEVYLGWKSYCAGRRARQRAAAQLNEVYFANERSVQSSMPGTSMSSFTTEHVRRIVALLDRARASINLCMYIVTVDSIGDALIRAAKRGVVVRVVGCSSMAYSSGSQMTRLVGAGIPVRFNRADVGFLMHHKFCLVDTDWICSRCYHAERVQKYGFCCANVSGGSNGCNNGSVSPINGNSAGGPTSPSKVPCDVEDGSRCVRCDAQLKHKVEKCKLQDAATESLPLAGLVLTGSTNWTMQALSGNWDNMVVTSMPELVQPFQMEFQRLWKHFACSPPIIGEEPKGKAAADQRQ